MAKALEITNLYYKQGNFVLRDINLDIEENEAVAIIGKSGAGKSTLLRLIGNAVVADAGVIKYFGKEMYEDERQIRGDMSVIFDESNFNTELKGIRLAKEIKRFEADFSLDRFHEYMKKFELDENMRIRFYSKGMQRKYALALALSRKPKLLIMDEVTSGVDENSRNRMWEVIAEYKKSNTLAIVFTTHHLEDIKLVKARTVTFDRGGIL